MSRQGLFSLISSTEKRYATERIVPSFQKTKIHQHKTTLLAILLAVKYYMNPDYFIVA